MAPGVARTAAADLAGRVGAAETQAAAGAAPGAVERTLTKHLSAPALPDVALDARSALADMTALTDRLNAPSALQIGDDVYNVMHGPTRRAMDMAGQRVDAAAASGGPVVDVTPMLEKVDALVRKYYPASVYQQTAQAASNPMGFLKMSSGFAGDAPRYAAAVAAAAEKSGAPLSMRESARLGQAMGLPPGHPLPGLIGKIQRLGARELSFEDAHALKMQLDNDINWGSDRQVRGVAKRIMRGARAQLRESMRGYQPYDEATAAYEQIAKLWNSKAGVSIQKAISNPNNVDALARSLSPANPRSAQVVKDLLTTQAEAGGDAAAGRQAWNGVRSAVAYDKVIKGGLDGLSTRVAKLTTDTPDFVRVVFGDTEGQTVLSNLRQIGAAVDGVKAAQKRLTESSIGKYTGPRNPDLLPPGASHTSIGMWLLRKAANGPRADDLVQWAALSPARTQSLVNVITSPRWTPGNAAFLRAALTAVGADEAPSEK
jgi:hypothetical protein